MTDQLSLADRLRVVAASGIAATLTLTPEQCRLLADACEGKPIGDNLKVKVAALAALQANILALAEKQALVTILSGCAASALLIALGVR